jgi:hypothetical protein
VGLEIVEAECIPIHLVTPYHRCDADGHTDDVDEGVALVSPKVPIDDLEVVCKHGGQFI